MSADFFPSKPKESPLTDEEWYIHCCKVWCVNSLKEEEGFYRSISRPFLINSDRALYTAILLKRAQNVISYLVNENERLKGETNHGKEKGSKDIHRSSRRP